MRPYGYCHCGQFPSRSQAPAWERVPQGPLAAIELVPFLPIHEVVQSHGYHQCSQDHYLEYNRSFHGPMILEAGRVEKRKSWRSLSCE